MIAHICFNVKVRRDVIDRLFPRKKNKAIRAILPTINEENVGGDYSELCGDGEGAPIFAGTFDGLDLDLDLDNNNTDGEKERELATAALRQILEDEKQDAEDEAFTRAKAKAEEWARNRVSLEGGIDSLKEYKDAYEKATAVRIHFEASRAKVLSLVQSMTQDLRRSAGNLTQATDEWKEIQQVFQYEADTEVGTEARAGAGVNLELKRSRAIDGNGDGIGDGNAVENPAPIPKQARLKPFATPSHPSPAKTVP